MREPFQLRSIAVKLGDCLRDERGVAMTEYLIVTVFVTLPAVFYLFHPDNGFYHSAREHFETTKLLLIFLGP
jgi:hypothetical protein